MKHFSKVFLLGALIGLIALLVAPVAAQDEELPEGAGEGGVLLTPNIGDDPATFNPIIGNDTSSSAITQWLYPPIFTVDPATQNNAPNVPGALASGWEYDESGTVLTITLRDDLFWNDGTPITAQDYIWATEAVRSGVTSSPRTSMFQTLDDGTEAGGKIVSIEAPDDYTVVVTFSEPDCSAFNDVNDVPAVPSHIFEELYGEDYALMDEEPRRIPEVSFGPFKDIEFAPGQRVSLIADQSYPDTVLGYVSPSEWVYLSVPDSTVSVERFIAGDVTHMGIPAERQAEFRDNPDFQTFEFSQNGFQYMGYNLGDPNNPQPGLDENGEVVEQDPHPIFGDARVRRAFAHAVDVDAIIDGILDGNGVRALTHSIPTSWVPNNLEPYAFDTELALEMLAEAGWVDDDGDVETPLVCQGCFYTEIDPEFEGSPLTFELSTNAGNVARERIGEIIQSQLGDIGVEVDFQAIDFATLVDILTAQTFDAIIIGWSLGLPVDPDVSWAYGPAGDLPGSGFSFTSYYNEEMMDLLNEARTLPGCDQTERAAIYEEVNRMLYEDQPYMYLYIGNVMYAAQPYIENWDPFPNFQQWNVDAWSVNN